MDVVASATGGEAFYNNNGLEAQCASDGSRVPLLYPHLHANQSRQRWTLPEDRGESGTAQFRRRIQTRLPPGLFRGRCEEGRTAATKPGEDPLHPFMGPGMPVSTQILFALRVKSGPAPTALDATPQMEQHSSAASRVGKIQMATHTDVVPGYENSTSLAPATTPI